MELKKAITVNDIFLHRFFIMGMSMMWIMLFHADFQIDNPVISYIKNTGYGGVDVFLLCSGFGCFCSLEKDNDVYAFIRKRFIRIMPTWLFYMLFWVPATLLVRGLPMQAVLGNVFCIQSLTNLGNSMNWYISAIWVFYILSPYLHEMCRRATLKGNILILLMTIIISIPFWGAIDLIVGASRLPVFYLGMIFAKYRTTKINLSAIVISFSNIIIGFVIIAFSMKYCSSIMWSHALFWYPFILITFGLCLVFFYLNHLFSKIKANFINNVFEKIGVLSFDVYLIQVLYFNVVRFAITRDLLPDNNLIWLVALMTALPISGIFNFIVCKIKALLKVTAK